MIVDLLSKCNRTFFAALLSLMILPGVTAANGYLQWGDEEVLISQKVSQSNAPINLLKPTVTSDGKRLGSDGNLIIPLSPKLKSSATNVTMNNLAIPDPEAVGTLEREMGGFGADMWRKTPRSLIDSLLPQLPITIRSPTMRDLARRLLLSTAIVPPRDHADPEKKSLIAMRAEKLQIMGLIGATAELISVAPTRLTDPDLLRTKVDNLFLYYDLPGACEVVRQQGNRLIEEFWQRSLVFCQALDNDLSGADLGLSLLAEEEGFQESVFYTLIDELTNGQSETGDGSTKPTPLRVDGLTNPTPLQLAMMRAANVRIPHSAFNRVSPAINGFIGVSPNAANDLRLEVAEWAAVMGGVTPYSLRQVYNSTDFSSEERKNAVSLAKTKRNSRGRALLFQDARVRTIPTDKVTALKQVWRLAREDNFYMLSVKIYEPMLLETPPLREIAWFAADATRALLILGKPRAAWQWQKLLLPQRTINNPKLKRDADLLWPIVEVASGNNTKILDQARMKAWQAAQREVAPEEVHSRIALGLTIFEALGYELNPEYWHGLLGSVSGLEVSMMSPALRGALRHASENGRKAETVLLALLALGQEDLGVVDPWNLYDVLVALIAVDLEEEARALALEVMLSAGL